MREPTTVSVNWGTSLPDVFSPAETPALDRFAVRAFTATPDKLRADAKISRLAQPEDHSRCGFDSRHPLHCKISRSETVPRRSEPLSLKRRSSAVSSRETRRWALANRRPSGDHAIRRTPACTWETTSAAIKARRVSVVGVLLGRAWLMAHTARAHRLRPAHSYLDTATKLGIDELQALRQLFTTGAWLPPALTQLTSYAWPT
jgi:hypothetical protein